MLSNEIYSKADITSETKHFDIQMSVDYINNIWSELRQSRKVNIDFGGLLTRDFL